MNYMRIMMACAAEPWALEKSKLISVANFLRFKAAGGKYSAEELQARITQKLEKEIQKSEGSIGILPIQGVIGERMNLLDDISGGTSTELISKQFRAMLNDNSVKAIILDVNSPGGVARSVEEIGQEIYDARGIKPIVAQVNTCAASAAYWIASQADEVVVTPSGHAGSIGVYTIHEDISEMLAMEGIKETLIYAGEFKVLGNDLEPLSDEAKSVMQQRVDELAASFTRAVSRGRGVSLTHVNEQFGQGLMFGASDLIDRGMADKVSPMSETLARFGIEVNPALARARAETSKVTAAGGNRLFKAAIEPLDEESNNKWKRFEDWAHRIGDDEVPPPSEFEGLLREAGVSKSRAARLASRAHGLLRSESGDNEASNAIARLSAAVKAFSPA